MVASAPGGRGVRLDGVERFGGRLPQRARPQAKFEGGKRTGAAKRPRWVRFWDEREKKKLGG